MIPFNLEKAKAGEALVTRNGRTDVKFISYELNCQRPVVIRIGDDIFVMNADGRLYVCDSDLDLFMAPPPMKRVKVWLNWYDKATVYAYTSKSAADGMADCNRKACIEVEIEVPVEE